MFIDDSDSIVSSATSLGVAEEPVRHQSCNQNLPHKIHAARHHGAVLAVIAPIFDMDPRLCTHTGLSVGDKDLGTFRDGRCCGKSNTADLFGPFRLPTTCRPNTLG